MVQPAPRQGNISGRDGVFAWSVTGPVKLAVPHDIPVRSTIEELQECQIELQPDRRQAERILQLRNSAGKVSPSRA